jgi:hypothetical protein
MKNMEDVTKTKDKKYEIIHAYIYDPSTPSLFKSGANEKSKLTTINCCNSENCGLFKRGQCSYLQSLRWDKCPYGKKNYEFGYTKRAKKYREWINEKKENYKDIGSLSNYSKMMAVVGDFVFLPYSFMNMCEKVPFEHKGGFMLEGSLFLPLKDFTVENIKLLVEFRPQALMGGEITSYQKEEVPLFLMHLKEQMPDLYKSVCEISDVAKIKSEKITNIGRKARLFSLTPNVGKFIDIHKGEWIWDGEWLTSLNSSASFMLVRDFEELKIKPIGNPLVTITDEQQVNENTVFEN